MILADQILLESNPCLISICYRWPTSEILDWKTMCTYVYSNEDIGYFCRIKPKDGETWRCEFHQNKISKNFEKNIQEESYRKVFFPSKQGLIELNTLKLYGSNSVHHMHVVDDNLFIQTAV